jgi:hypothetical protein
MRSRTLATVGLALLLVLAGCSAGSSGGGGDVAVSGGGGDGAETGAQRQASTDGGAGGETTDASAGATDRVRIRTGQMTLTVSEYGAARENLTALARERGGYVSDSTLRTHSRGNATWQTGQLVIRVPEEEFGATFEAAKTRGTVESSSTSTEDVTDRLVDLNARLENLRAQRDRLRTLYDEANETEAVLRISERLSEVQGEIERLEAQKRALEQRVAYSTITVSIQEEPPERDLGPEPTQWYDIGVIAAFLESVSGVVTALRALVVLAAYVAPYALVFGSPFVVAAALLYRRYG